MKKLAILLFVMVLLVGFASHSSASFLDIGEHDYYYTGETRGYWFTAPVDFTITGLRAPLIELDDAPQNIEVLRLNDEPPTWIGTTNEFVSLAYWTDIDSLDFISTSILVAAGDIIGILGDRGGVNSYGASNTYDTKLGGYDLTLYRFGFQGNLSDRRAENVWTEASLVYGRVEMRYEMGTPIPEPSTILLLGAGLLGLAGLGRKRFIKNR